MEPLERYFADMDSEFINMENVKDEVYTYNATDVLVQTSWELPIVIQWPDSTINFEFSSEPGDISFGIVFVAAPEEDQDLSDLEIETIEEMNIVHSNTEVVSGSFEVPYEGVVFFLWDNNYDWSANKKISYLIEARQPSYTVPEQSRIAHARPELKKVVDQLEIQYSRRADTQDSLEHLEADTGFLEEQLQSLQLRWEAKKREKYKLEDDIVYSRSVLKKDKLITPGLYIRSLNKHLLSLVLSFLNPKGGINLVSKYWSEIAANNRIKLPSGPEKVIRTKVNKYEISSSIERLKKSLKKKIDSKKIENIENQEATTIGDSPTSLDSGKPPEKNMKTKNSSKSTGDSNIDTIIGDTTGEDINTKNAEPGKSRNSENGKKTKKSDMGSNNKVTFQNENTKEVKNNTMIGNKKMQISFDNLLNGNQQHLEEHFTKKINPVSPPTSDNKVNETVEKHGKVSTSYKQTPLINLSLSRSNDDETGYDNKKPFLQPEVKEKLSKITENEEIKKKKNKENSLTMEKLQKHTISTTPEKTSITSQFPQLQKQQKENEKNISIQYKNRAADTEKKLLQHVQKIRSEQQMDAMIEYLQAGFLKIENLTHEKRRIKKLIRAWNVSFEKKNARFPTSSERKGHLRELYEEYHQISLALRIREEKMEETLKSVGLTRQQFDELLDKRK